MRPSNVLVHAEPGGVIRVTINRPDKHNPLSLEVLTQVGAAVAEVAHDAAARCVVIRGAGEKYFAAGGDLRALADVRTEAQTVEIMEASRAALDAIRACPVPVIALLNGDALGGGAELAVSCDLRVIRAGARIGFIQGRLNICSAWGGGPDLFSLVGRARALRMATRAEMIDARTALDWGLVDEICADDALEEGLADFVAPMLKQTPLVMRAWKRQVQATRGANPYADARAIEREMIIQTWLHEAHWAAVDRVLAPSKETA